MKLRRDKNNLIEYIDAQHRQGQIESSALAAAAAAVAAVVPPTDLRIDKNDTYKLVE